MRTFNTGLIALPLAISANASETIEVIVTATTEKEESCKSRVCCTTKAGAADCQIQIPTSNVQRVLTNKFYRSNMIDEVGEHSDLHPLEEYVDPRGRQDTLRQRQDKLRKLHNSRYDLYNHKQWLGAWTHLGMFDHRTCR